MTVPRWSGQRQKPGEAGQAMLFVLLAMGLVLLGAVAFSVDMGNLWFHRQSAQNVADAACTAAAMDMLFTVNGGGPKGGFTAGTNFKCSGNSTAAPCVYAAKNMGYNASTMAAGTPGYDVSFKFPGSIPGLPTCSTGVGAPEICNDPTALTNNFVQVNVQDRVRLSFAGLLKGLKTTDVGAQASCGVVLSNSPIPILVLDPRNESSLIGSGNINITIVGGPQRSVQVNSSSTTAVSIAGASGTIDLTHGGPNNSGSDFGVTGNESAVGIFQTAGSGRWISQAPAISDPFAQIPAPAVPANAAPPSDIPTCASLPCVVAQNVHGCPDPAGCYLYTPGHYSSEICVGKGSCTFKALETAIFDPGIYYLDSNLRANSNSCIRPSTAVGDGSGGAMFYFAGTGTLAIGSNSGTGGVCPTTKVPLSQVQCVVGPQLGAPGATGITVLPANVLANGGLSGNVLLGPCQAASSMSPSLTRTSPCTPNCSKNYGDPLGIDDPLGEQRGMLFFQNRSLAPSTQPSWSGGGAFGLAGNLYFHFCSSTSGGTGNNCDPVNAFTDQLSLGGGTASDTFVVGDLVVDKLNLNGNPLIEMDLNPNALFYVYKASLLQ